MCTVSTSRMSFIVSLIYVMVRSLLGDVFKYRLLEHHHVSIITVWPATLTPPINNTHMFHQQVQVHCFWFVICNSGQRQTRKKNMKSKSNSFGMPYVHFVNRRNFAINIT